jgi:UDP-N-acetylmuramyl pentapeptide phosphotransferase/UDP-N-acetylglucosamine-1-phosphate transferase
MVGAPWAILAIGIAVMAIAYVVSRAFARRGLLPDRPNGRSSHAEVTPRSGGMAITAAWMIGMFLVVSIAPSTGLVIFPLIFITLFVFIVGLVDDKYSLPASIKLAAQMGAAVAFIGFLGALQAGPAPFVGLIVLGVAGPVLTVLWIVGFMNAYNFMDGVNGIAAACGGFALAALAAAAAFSGATAVAVGAGFLAFALFGFLPVNFPSGRIFMGDNGSQAVGFLAAALAILAAAETEGKISALFLPTAFAPFLFDVIFTVSHRFLRGRNVAAAHREHVYQLLSRRGWSHSRVAASYLAATAVSAAAAFAALQLPPKWQFAPLAWLFLAFLPPALSVLSRARRAGMLERREARPSAPELGSLEAAPGAAAE